MIREISVSLVAVAGFGLALWWCGVAAATQRALRSSMDGLTSMLDRELDDAAKEVAVRRAGIGLVVGSLSVLWRFCVALAAAAVPILLADALGVASGDAVIELMVRLDYIVVVSVVGIVLVELLRRWGPATPQKGPADARYSMADRVVHAVAFSRPGVLKAASAIEDRLLSRSAQAPSAPPIFITSLARAGTTALLTALSDMPGVATHTYRDMPFLTAPTLWNRLAGGERRNVERHERAHGDGLEIDLDSPEAFEEVIWTMFWPEKYGGSAIGLWRPQDRKAEAEQFLARHMEKVIRARQIQGHDDVVGIARYCSKNNGNVARLPYLVEAFDGCRIVVPIRRPESQAASLLRQHNNFLALQAEDDFVRRYMRDIGHFEFGLIQKPIRFPGFDPDRHDPRTGDYWLSYWTHAFREVLEHSADCLLVSQDDLRSSPQETMAKLCDALGLPQAHVQFDSHFHSSPDEAPTGHYDQRIYEEAAALYRQLEAVAL